MLRQLSGGKEPFLAAFYSLTSHHPYPVPAAFRGRYPQGPLEILESIGYADDALAHFFAEAQQQPWYRDTLFVITGDHTEKPLLPSFDNEIGRYRVPLIFFHPAQAWPQVDTAQPTQHADVVASILDFLGIDDGESLQFGRSVFRSGERYVALYNTVDYFLLDRAWSLRFHPPKEWLLYDGVRDPALRKPLRKWPREAKALRSRLLATLQYFNNGLIEDRLLLPTPAPTGDPAAVTAPRGPAR